MDMCRCCIGQRGDMQPLFGSSIDTMLMAVTGLTLAAGDGLPAKICKRCLLLVSRMFTFKRQCEETDHKLRQAMQPAPDNTLVLANPMLCSGPCVEQPLDGIGLVVALKSDGDTPQKPSDETTSSDEPSEAVTVLESFVEMPSNNQLSSLQDGELLEMAEFYFVPAAEMEYDKFESFHLLDHGDVISVETIESSTTVQVLPDGRQAVQNVASTYEETVVEPTIDAAGVTLPVHYCTVCRKQFERPTQLRRHLKTHLTDKPHRCTLCGNTFAESSNLKKHMARHTGELRNVTGLPHLCAVCGKRFKFATSLSRHSRVHTKRNLYRCPQCPEHFIERSALLAHTYAHTNRKPFTCQRCPKSFARKVNLTRHERSHTGEKPFHCPLCEKRFSQKSYLAIHQRIHANEKPYHCADCGKRFVASSGLAVHRRTHLQLGMHACILCGKHFQRKASLNKHRCTAGHVVHEVQELLETKKS